MGDLPPHLFVDISSHGFGHLSQTAPVLNELAELLPDLRITLRSGLAVEKLRQRRLLAAGRRRQCRYRHSTTAATSGQSRSRAATVAKPGYGTFAEAVRNGTAVIYQRREDWPEQNCLIDWLKIHGRCTEVSARDLASGNLANAMSFCLDGNTPPMPVFDGAAVAARRLAALLS